jgi:hypothetical protein
MQKLKTYTFALSYSKSQFALLHLGDMGKVACTENSTCFRNAHNLPLVSVGYEVQAFFCSVICNSAWHDQFVTHILQYKVSHEMLKVSLLTLH